MADDHPSGAIRLIDSYQPGLKDGDYTLTVDQTLSVGTVPSTTHKFTVAGPRFAIDPADIHAQFPPPGHSGQFAEVLPHLVMTKRLLPWERSVDGLDDSSPWMALLVFEEGELLGDAPGDGAETATVADLLTARSGVRAPNILLSSLTSDEQAMSCRTITMTNTTFAALMPTGFEIPFLSHARRVDDAGKVLLNLKDEGLFSVVVANRFPAPAAAPYGAKAMVHLVSLEGFGDFLTGAAPVAPVEATVRMVSLASWTFSCLPDPAQTFSGLATNLAYDAAGTPRPADEFRLRIPVDPSAQASVSGQRLADGYSALGYHAVSGEDGFAWYRGPLAPVVPSTLSVGPFRTAAAAMIYDPATGVFDHSLAAAWRAGHALALADQSFAVQLVGLRAGAAGLLGVHGDGSAADLRLAAAGVVASAVQGLSAASVSGDARPAPLPAPAGAPAPPIDTVRAAIAANGDGLTALADDPDAAAAAAWLGRLQLLAGLPFLHLVPDERMLPAESIRFAFLDYGWIGAALDGALAIGVATSRDAEVQAQLSAQLKTMAASAAQSARADALHLPVPPAPIGPCAAMLIRSALISGWPGLSVAASAAGTAMAILRLERVGADVLICLFNGVPDLVTLTQPHEGLEFGVDDKGQLTTRTVTDVTITNVAEVKIYDPQADTQTSPALRPGGGRVLNVRLPAAAPADPPVDLIGLLAKGLSVGNAPPVDPATITPARFALQMVKGPEQIVFSPNPPPRPPQESNLR